MKVVFISLGCDKNTVDTQQMAGMLQDSAAQYTFTDDEEEADIAVVNTCAFINSAKEESIGQKSGKIFRRWTPSLERRRKISWA